MFQNIALRCMPIILTMCFINFGVQAESQKDAMIKFKSAKTKTEAWAAVFYGSLRYGTMSDIAKTIASGWWAHQPRTTFMEPELVEFRKKEMNGKCEIYYRLREFQYDKSGSNFDQELWREALKSVGVVRRGNFMTDDQLLMTTRVVAGYIHYAVLFNQPPACHCEETKVEVMKHMCKSHWIKN